MPDLSDGLNWSEIDANNNNASPNGWPEGMMPSGVNDAARADRGALKRFWDKLNPVQTITPSGGVWTFTTGNIAYPTGYIGGELYCFRPGASSAGGDQFQVNALGPKPILRCTAPGTAGWVPVIGQDIYQGIAAQLVYDATLNAGAGAFVLLNPFAPIHGDGAGGVNVSGGDLLLGRTDQAYAYIVRPNTAGFNNLAFAASGYVPLNDVNVLANTVEVSGTLAANGYISHSGLGGAYQSNVFNIQWTGASAHLWIDATDEGPIVTASPSGDVVTSGLIQTTSTGASSGGVSIYATAGAIRSDVDGTALYLPNGDVVCQGVTASQLQVNGNAAITGNAVAGSIQSSSYVIAGTYGQFNQGLYITGAYPFDAGGHTLYVNGSVHAGNLTVINGAVINPASGQMVALTVNGGIDVHPSGGDCMHAFGNVDIDGNLSVGTLNGHPAMDIFTRLDALTARVQALEDQTR